MTKDQYDTEVSVLEEELNDLRQQLEAAQKACAEKDDALKFALVENHLDQKDPQQCPVCLKLQHALSTDCGKDFVPLEKLKRACSDYEAMKEQLDAARKTIIELKLLYEVNNDALNEKAAACAEMRELLEVIQLQILPGLDLPPKYIVWFHRALSPDCGKGWVSPEKVKALVDSAAEMRQLLKVALDNDLDAGNDQLRFQWLQAVSKWDSAKKDL